MSEPTVSENVSKSNGRPRVMNAEQERNYKRFFPGQTHRSRQNQFRAGFAIRVLHAEGAEKFPFLLGKKPKMTALAELGRWEDAWCIIDLAKKIEEAFADGRVATAAHAVEASRRIRLDGRRKPQTDYVRLMKVWNLVTQWPIEDARNILKITLAMLPEEQAESDD